MVYSRVSESSEPRSKATKDLQLQRLLKIVARYLSDTCTRYTWCNPLLGAIRARDLPRVYQLADNLSTEVFESAAEHFAANQLGALILKYPFHWRSIGLPRSPRDAAIDKFLAAEVRCKKTNRRFRSLGNRSTRFAGVIQQASVLIERVIGREPPSDIFDYCAFGPGTNVGVSGNATNLARKFWAKDWTVTPAARYTFISALTRNYHFVEAVCAKNANGIACIDLNFAREQFDSKIKVVSHNKVSFVPKTAKTSRSIAVEPLGNLYLQKSVDSFLKRRLLAVGIDLQDQSRNATLAYEGSMSNELATLDLSAASDTIALQVAKRLLPPAWFCLLDSIRSPSYRLNKSEDVRYEKLASMGNGFCFPVETLIFWAIATSACELRGPARAVSAYGDDIIVPSKHASAVCDALKFCGFVINSEKSFVTGPFRESCGADWYEGQDVRPVYLDYPLDEGSALRIFHNATLRSVRVSEAFTGVRETIRSWVPSNELFLRPEHTHTERDRFSGERLERWELKNLNGAFTVPLDIFMGSRFASWNRAEWRFNWTEEVYSPLVDKPAMRIPEAVYWAHLLGSPRGELHLRRQTERRSIVK